MKVLLVSEMDKRTNKIRRGSYLRFKYPPEGVKYTLFKDLTQVASNISQYEYTMNNFFKVIFNLIYKGFSQPMVRDENIIHSFFWNFYLYNKPWIHENDESPSQFLKQYYGYEGFTYNRALDFLVYYLNFSLCRGIITWSEWARRGFIKDGVDSSKVKVVHLPMEVHKKIEHQGVNVIYIGRDFYRKGGDMVLKVFYRLLKDFDTIKLFYVGSLPNNIRKLVQENKNIYYYQNPSDDMLYNKLLPASDVLFLPTRSDAYALTIVEAMSYGIPSVVSNINSIGETIIHGKTGFMGYDEDSYYKYMGLIIENEKLRKSFSEESKELVKERHNPVTIGNEIKKVYEEVISGM
jgi:glycosyltransferase involved in cell wall biosynthesis